MKSSAKLSLVIQEKEPLTSIIIHIMGIPCKRVKKSKAADLLKSICSRLE